MMSNDNRDADIRIDRIPVRGGIGAAVVVIALVASMLVDVPGLRIAIIGIAGGVIVGTILIAWRRKFR